MGTCRKDAVFHRTEVKGDNEFNDYKQEEHFCPSLCNISEVVVEEKEEDGDFNE